MKDKDDESNKNNKIVSSTMSKTAENAIKVNREVWNHWAKLHPSTKFYDKEKFKRTKNSLNKLELELLGDIKRKKTLHLQCHFGQDTLSLAGLGADVTGVDISEEAIKAALQLSKEIRISAKFI